jgi:hypothetical protein
MMINLCEVLCARTMDVNCQSDVEEDEGSQSRLLLLLVYRSQNVGNLLLVYPACLQSCIFPAVCAVDVISSARALGAKV